MDWAVMALVLYRNLFRNALYSRRGVIQLQNGKKDSLFGSCFVPARGKRVTNWRSLVGHTVQIWQGNDVLDQGLVEAVTADGTVLWLAQTGAIQRRLVMKERGAGLWVRLMN